MMAGINLDFLSPEKREFLRRRAEERNSSVERELERLVDEAMSGISRSPDPLQDVVREEAGTDPTGDLSAIVGVLKGPDPVTSENFHDYLYGEQDVEE